MFTGIGWFLIGLLVGSVVTYIGLKFLKRKYPDLPL